MKAKAGGAAGNPHTGHHRSQTHACLPTGSETELGVQTSSYHIKRGEKGQKYSPNQVYHKKKHLLGRSEWSRAPPKVIGSGWSQSPAFQCCTHWDQLQGRWKAQPSFKPPQCHPGSVQCCGWKAASDLRASSLSYIILFLVIETNAKRSSNAPHPHTSN